VAPGPDDDFDPPPDDDVLDEDAAVDEEPSADNPEGEPGTALPPRLEAWRRRSATGAILTGFARGLQQVFEKEQEQPSIIMTTSGDPPKDLPVEAEVEQGRPRQSVVNIRPWLLDKPAPAEESPADDGPEKDK
jgi:hypothetical protein